MAPYEVQGKLVRRKTKCTKFHAQKLLRDPAGSTSRTRFRDGAGPRAGVTTSHHSQHTTAVREAVLKVMEQKGLPVMVFSTDVPLNKAVVCAGILNSGSNGLGVLEWLNAAMVPLKGKGGGGKNGIAQGQGSDASRVKEAMDIVVKLASVKLC